MAESSIAGTRIRERRVSRGLRQSDLAQRVGISPSYLNLIEHNRRRIGGRTLLKLAEVLEVEPAMLSEGAEATLIAALRLAAGEPRPGGPETDRTDEFIGRFPGWADLLLTLFRENESLERTVTTLTDRLAHDPYLADSLHEVISTVTAIRSTASILADTRELEPEWRNRFHRNINEDSARLAEGAENLVRYLERAPDTKAEIRSPQDEVHAYLAGHGYHFPALEADPGEAAVDRVLEAAGVLTSAAARDLARRQLRRYCEDVAQLPIAALRDAIQDHGLEPATLAQRLNIGLPLLFRRVAMLPESEIGPVGLVSCDASGALVFRKPCRGFDVPQIAGACALWPLFQVLSQPLTPVAVHLRQAGRGTEQVLAMAAAETRSRPSFDDPSLLEAYMLILPDRKAAEPEGPRLVGVNCPICSLEDCPARREPSIFSQGFDTRVGIGDS